LLFKVLKKRYKKELLRKTVLSEADADYRVSQLKNINLEDCCYMIAPALNSILGSTFRVSWKKILGYNEECLSPDEVEHGNEIFETAEKDENKEVDVSDEPNKGLCHSKTHSGLKVSLK
ncbi:hypothetical protein T01_11340, partial [Trichinella spiralis]